MDKNKTSLNGDCATAIPNDFCCSSLTPRQMLARQLRELSIHVSDMDRCTLCKAADELEKSENNGMSWVFQLLLLAMVPTLSGSGSIEPGLAKSVLEAIGKEKESHEKGRCP